MRGKARGGFEKNGGEEKGIATRTMPLPYNLWSAASDFKQMVPKLRFHRSMDLAEFAAKHDGIKFFDHLAGTKFAQVSTLFA